MFGRKKQHNEEEDYPSAADNVYDNDNTLAAPATRSSDDDNTLTDQHDKHHPYDGVFDVAVIKRATRTRFIWSLISSFGLLISVVFLILVEIGNTRVNSTLNKIYFLKIDVSDIIPLTVPDATLINSIAQTLGLHDFYTVGLWNYCEGYNGQGTTDCGHTHTEYWFNPVAILEGELVAGATIALPSDINSILNLIKVVSQIMFGLFLTGVCLNFINMFVVPASVFSRWGNVPIAISTFLGALLTTAGAIIATVMFVIFRNVITSATELNIKSNIGTEMFVFMWFGAAGSLLAWLIQMGMFCCCASRRDVRTGRKRGNKKAYEGVDMGAGEGLHGDGVGAGEMEEEKPAGEKRRLRMLPTFGRAKRE